MKIKLILPLLCLAFNVFGQNNNAGDSLNHAKIEFEEKVHDFGILGYGDDCSCDIKFKNTGTAPLIISQTSTSCGCDIATAPNEPIFPGQTGVIHYKYDSHRIGQFSKVAYIHSNAWGNETVILSMKGQVIDNRPPSAPNNSSQTEH